MHELIARHVVYDPVVPGQWRQIGHANSVAVDGEIRKQRDPSVSLLPEDCELQIVDGVIERPFVLRFSEGAPYWGR